MTRFLASLALLCLASFASAAERIPADCKWVVHVDAQALLRSKAGEWIGRQLTQQPMAARLKMLESISGLDPRRDIRSVTICGAGAEDDSGLVFVRGTFDADRLTMVAQAAEGHVAIPAGGRVIHTWLDRDKPSAGCLAAADLLILGRTADRLREALDLSEGLQAGAVFPLPPGWDGAALVVCAADELAALAAGKPESAMLRNVRSFAGRIVEDGAQFAVEARATAISEATAQQLVDAGRGLAAILQLQRPAQIDASLIAAVQSAKLSREGSTVSLRLTLPIEDAVRLIEQRKAR